MFGSFVNGARLGRLFGTRLLFLFIATAPIRSADPGALPGSWFEPAEGKDHAVIAFVGGGDVATAQHTGHFESLLAGAKRTARFRNFGWEGDTVFAQPRDFNFPPLTEHLRRADATLVFVQFGRMEAFAPEVLKDIRGAYAAVLDDLAKVTPRLVLVTPVPFEKPDEPLPDVSVRNSDLEKVTTTIRELGKERGLTVLDVFSKLRTRGEKLTEDGVQLTARGHGIVALALAGEMGLTNLPSLAKDGTWESRRYEELRQATIRKNRLWFDYWRPQNWAFLGGDRTEQPSSRDHRNPKVRWFPSEMERFQPLIAAKEREMAEIARSLDEK